MRVLILTLSYPPDAGSNAPVMKALSHGLKVLGHEMFVVSSFPHYGHSRPYPGYRSWRFKHESSNGIHVLRTPLYVGREGSRSGKILSWLSFNLIGTWAAAKAQSIDVIIASSPPPTLGLSGWLLARLWNAPYVYNGQDIYPDVAVEQGHLRNRHLIAFLRKVEDMISLIIPSRNERYLNQTIAEVKAKFVGDYEIIVILDGADSDRVEGVNYLYNKKPNGMRTAINQGVKEAKGKYLMKLDAHCMVDHGMDEKLRVVHQDNWVQVPRRH